MESEKVQRGGVSDNVVVKVASKCAIRHLLGGLTMAMPGGVAGNPFGIIE
jgi:hypothetical protein